MAALYCWPKPKAGAARRIIGLPDSEETCCRMARCLGPEFFLIATPERMYLWKHQPAGMPEAPPEYTADAQKVLEPYFEKLRQKPSAIGPEAFEFLVLTWLVDIARSGHSELNQGTSSELSSELTGSLQQARIEMHPVQ